MSGSDDWDDKFGHINPFEKKDRRGFDWEYKTAYCCEITAAQLSTSPRGIKQIQLHLRVLDGDGEDPTEAGRAIQNFDLPKQEADLEMDEEVVKKLHTRRFLDVMRILSVGEPETYSLYKSAEGDGKQKRFIGFDDRPMGKAEFAHREQSTQADCRLWVENAHERMGSSLPELVGGRIYLAKIRNPKSEKYPWTNIYAVRPQDFPVFSRSAAAVPF